MYVILTSDGVVHETAEHEEAVSILDRYGPEVVDHNLDDPIVLPSTCAVCGGHGCEHCPAV